ncbi:hypothetical protein QO034_06500 [Sedimentitalea sp. JM2-8]|uniref:Uncharacterized protein n=1 Tax=Sedimentitalea xiamensis TaxID=3050037 RepID=A0ABT7FCC3_9RHOB|nr:hypothetical protein [Sedimentitalea xiamensis]MDK3072754.1 hypothetical protein [Sedimentitalea xiamensis]
MPWRWSEPGPKSRAGRGFGTKVAAQDSAIYTAFGKLPDDAAQRDRLWDSLAGIGWAVRWYQV